MLSASLNKTFLSLSPHSSDHAPGRPNQGVAGAVSDVYVAESTELRTPQTGGTLFVRTFLCGVLLRFTEPESEA